MEKYFSISQGYTQFRPSISYKVREYLEGFILENILQKKKIVVGGKWGIKLAIYFVGEGKYGIPETIDLQKNPTIINSEKTKLYEIFVPVKPIQESQTPLFKAIELMYEAITVFFTTTYKKITKELMDELWSHIDLDYLLSLPYPAPMEDQKYVGDMILPDGTVKNIVPRPD